MLKNEMIYPGMRVVIIGFGVSGKAALRYLLKCGADVRISDARSISELTNEEQELLATQAIQYEGGDQEKTLLNEIDLIFVSPGVPSSLPLLVLAKERGISVVGELALAGPAISSPVVAITGTNGKTTVTSLVGELLKGAGKKVFVGGNIGVPLFDYLVEGEAADVVVLEVSSFQLENSGEFRPNVALLLNVTPDHLDRHGSLEGYRDAKARIFLNQRDDDIAIICGDDDICRQVGESLGARKPLMFGYGEACQARIIETGVKVDWQGQREYDFRSSALGNHMGRLNGAAAILTLLALGCESSAIGEGLNYFSPPPHRMELVEELDGVIYIDDSKATNTGAVLSALEQVAGRVLLIAGGRDKGDDYTLLQGAVEEKVGHVFLLGEAAGKIAHSLGDVVPVSVVETMEKAVVTASHKAEKGDTVLLSPACASFDMFDSYEHRGDVFSAAVRSLCEQRSAS